MQCCLDTAVLVVLSILFLNPLFTPRLLPLRSSFLATQTSPAAPPHTAGFPSSMVKAAGPLAAPGVAFFVT